MAAPYLLLLLVVGGRYPMKLVESARKVTEEEDEGEVGFKKFTRSSTAISGFYFPTPSLFDGTTRLYINYQCPYAQRVWITRNVKGLQDKINLVPIDLQNRPDWYKEKVYPPNKVPSLEHNNKVIGESLDLVKYIDSNFEGPSLLPDDPEKQKFAEELIAYSDTFVPEIYRSFMRDAQTLAGAQFDYLEKALGKFDDGPFFLGQFSQVDIAYVPFIERFQIFMPAGFNYDITSGRPKLAKWIEEMDKLDGYKQTKVLEPEKLVEYYKNLFLKA